MCRFETIYNISENKLSNSKKNYLSKNLVYVGNISFFKGVDRLLDVAKHLMDTNLKIKYMGKPG